MTLTRKNATHILMGFLSYIRFVWGISWRTALLAIITAIVSGIALGVVSTANAWPPEAIETIAPYIGLPITLLVFTYVLFRQTQKIFLKTKPAIN